MFSITPSLADHAALRTAEAHVMILNLLSLQTLKAFSKWGKILLLDKLILSRSFKWSHADRHRIRDSSNEFLSLSFSPVYLLHQLGHDKGNSVYWFCIGLKAMRFYSGTRGHPFLRPISIVLWNVRVISNGQFISEFSLYLHPVGQLQISYHPEREANEWDQILFVSFLRLYLLYNYFTKRYQHVRCDFQCFQAFEGILLCVRCWKLRFLKELFSLQFYHVLGRFPGRSRRFLEWRVPKVFPSKTMP